MPDTANTVYQSINPDDFKNFISNHFDTLTAPAVVSIGYKTQIKISEIVSLLRQNGINAAGYYHKEASFQDTFIVDNTGIRSPLLNPQDALQSTVDIYNILKSNNIEIQGHALPQTAENFVYIGYGTTRTIDVAQNAQNVNSNINKEEINSFITQQLSCISQLPCLDIAELDEQNADEKFLYRGGTLGAQPFAITSVRRGRDTAYGTPKFSRASKYATGAKSMGISYLPVKDKNYGFIYEFDAAPNQKYYKAYGIENAAQDPKLDNNGEEVDFKYETPLMPHRNNFRNIYLQYGDDDNAKIIKITENGKFISPEWETFTKLHEVFSHSEQNDIMRERINMRKKTPIITPYQKSEYPLAELTTPQTLNNYVLSENINATSNNITINNLSLKSCPVPEDIRNIRLSGNLDLNNITLPKTMTHLDLSRCTGTIYINNCDLSHIQTITFPEQCQAIEFGNNTLSPSLTEIDLSATKTNHFFLTNQDCKMLKSLKFPQRSCTGDTPKYHINGDNKIPQHTNLGGCTDKALQSQLFYYINIKKGALRSLLFTNRQSPAD